MKKFSFLTALLMGIKVGVYITAALGTIFSIVFGATFAISEVMKKRVQNPTKESPNNILHFPD